MEYLNFAQFSGNPEQYYHKNSIIKLPNERKYDPTDFNLYHDKSVDAYNTFKVQGYDMPNYG